MMTMKIINVDNTNENQFNTAIALGNFDGVHIGHQKLIETMLEQAKEKNLLPSMLIFENHTKSFVYGNGPRLLNTNSQKNEFLEKLGVRTLYTMKFNEHIMTLSPENFVKEILLKKLNCSLVVVGTDYRFGHKASGNVGMLKDIGKRLGLQVRVVEPVYYKDEIVSSTLVRQLLSEGNIRDANRLLGRPFGIVGEVINGKGLGKRLGVPTANIKPAGKYVVPKKGVYRTITRVNERYYPSATNVGINPTFSEQELKVETYILDFDQSIYGLEIEVYFMEYIRPEIKFENTDKLKQKMDEDIAYVRSKSNLQLI